MDVAVRLTSSLEALVAFVLYALIYGQQWRSMDWAARTAMAGIGGVLFAGFAGLLRYALFTPHPPPTAWPNWLYLISITAVVVGEALMFWKGLRRA